MSRRYSGQFAVWGIVVFLLPLSALAAPKWVRVSYTGDTAHSMTVSFNDGPAEAVVEYGLTDSYGMGVNATSIDAGGEIGVVHEATLTGLTPDTTYHYRVGAPGDFSPDHVFHTGPIDVCAPFSFGVAADNRQDFDWLPSGCWPQVYGKVAGEGVDFVINSGDLVLDGKEDDQWHDFLDDSEEYMDEIPLIPCLGNHDDDSVEGDGALYNRIFALPRNGVNNTEDFYSFDYGNVHFAALSTETFKDDGDYKYQQQHDWLVQDLASTDRMWKVVFFHRPIYSSGGHGGNEDGQNPVFIPVFDEYHVDLVLTGHDHMYEVYGPMYDGEEVSSCDDGTVYMVSGGGGAAMIPPHKHHYLVITVTNNVMHIRAQRAETSCLTIGSGGSGVIDEFDIIKTLEDDPCQGGGDQDGDGFASPSDCCDTGNEPSPGCSLATAASIYPGAEEICEDGIDQNCDGQDEACPCPDADQDGYQSDQCGGDDCDDSDQNVNPGAVETCGDSIDNDCDGDTDEGDCELCVDADMDGYYDISQDCPSGTDCDDDDNLVYPGAEEICNDKDDDCDNETDEGGVCGQGCMDNDNDGHDGLGENCPEGDDCDDDDPDVHSGAQEVCDGKDNDCDTLVDEDLGNKTCGVGACFNTVDFCVDGQESVCEPLERPEDPETSCDDEVDNDCDGYVDAEDTDCKAPGSGCGCSAATADQRSGALFALMLLGLILISRRR